MAAKDDKSKTSKTARVMNLLSKKSDPTLPAEEPQAEGPAAEPAAKPASPSAPMLASLSADAAVSGQIKDALEGALADELSPKAPAAQEAPAQFTPLTPPQSPPPIQSAPPAPQPSAPPVQAPPPVQSAPPVQAPPPVQSEAPVPESPAAPAEDASPFLQHAAAASGGYVNVMQVLVEEKAPKYIKLFGLCDCERCLEDVKALALNHLPPKYVVMDKGDMIPKLTFYEGKYSSDITAQLLHACKAVMERPHHQRQNG